MNAGLLSSRLTCALLGRRLECHDALPSTGDRARELLDQIGPAAHGAVVTADRQTAGRGRMGRPWFAQPGKSLTLTVALWPGGEPVGYGALPLAAALAVRQALATLSISALLKWPNDVLAGGRKIAGVLIESRFAGEEPRGLTVGIGVNLGQSREDFPPELRDVATSVRAEGGRVPETEVFAADLLNAIEPLLNEALAVPAALVERTRSAWVHRLGEDLVVEAGESRVEGGFAGVGPGDELLLQTGHGRVALRHGEVTLLRRGGTP